MGGFLPTLWVEIISQAGLVFPVISLLSIWLMVVYFAARNPAVTFQCLVYCMVIANLRFDDEQFFSAWLHVAFFFWLVHVLVRIIACLPTAVLYFNGQLALEGRRPLVNIRFGYLLTNGEEHLVRRQRVVDKKLRARAYARIGREQQARLRMAGKRQRALLYERFGVEQEARATAQATARVADEKARQKVLRELQSTLLKERKITFWQQSRDLEFIRRGVLRLSPYGPRQQAAVSKADVIDRYEAPRPDDINGSQSDTDDNGYGDDEDSSDDDDDSHRPHGTPVLLRYRKLRATKIVQRIPASSFRQPALRWKLPPCFPVTKPVGPPVCSGSTTPASSSQPSPKQPKTPAFSPPLPTPASSASQRRAPKPVLPAFKAPAVKPTKPGKSKKSAARDSSTDGTPPASTSEKTPLVISAPIEKPAAPSAEKSIEKVSGEGSVVGEKEASPVGNEPEKELESPPEWPSLPWLGGQQALPELEDSEIPWEFLSEGDKAEPEDFEWLLEGESDDGNAEIAPSNISADCDYETDGDVAMEHGLPRGRTVLADNGHEVDSDVDMDSDLSEDSDVEMDNRFPEDSDVDMDSELPGVPRATEESMEMDTTPAQIATQVSNEDMDVDEDWDALVEAFQGWTITPPATQTNAGGQFQTPAPSLSAPPADPSPLPLTSAPRSIQNPPVPRPNDAGHHYQPPHSSSSASTFATSSSSAAAASSSASSSATTAAFSSAASSSAASSSAASCSASPSSAATSSSATSSFSPSAASSFAFSDPRPEPPREMCLQPNLASTSDLTDEDSESPFDLEDEEREMCSASHPAAELCQNPRCPHFSLRTPHWYVDPEMMAGLMASMEPAGSSPVHAPVLVLRPPQPTQPDLSTLNRPLSGADLPAQCSSTSCRHNQTPHWHLGGWVVTNEEQALNLLKCANKGKGKEKREPPSKPETHDADGNDDKGKGKEQSAPPPEPANFEPSHEDDKCKDKEDEDMGVEKPAPPSEPSSNEDDKNDEAPAPPDPSSEHAPHFVLTPHLKSFLSTPTSPAPTSSPVSIPPPTAQDPSTLTFADLPPPCSSHSCAWTHKKHWHITNGREVLTTEKQALTALRRKLSKATCAPPPPPPPPKPKSDSDESSDEDEDDPPPQNSGLQQPSTPAAPAPPPPPPPNTRQTHPTPTFDPDNHPLDAEMNAYFEVHGPYAPDPPPTTAPAGRVIRPMRSVKNRAAVRRLRNGG